MSDKESDKNIPTLLSVKDFSNKHKSFNQAALRYLLFHRESNKFAPCVKKIGRRLYIEEKEFFNIIETLQEGNKNAKR